MKCTNCGKNNASYHYRYNVNGKVTEAHLCPDCAAKMGESAEGAAWDDVFGSFDRMMEDMWGGFFGRRSLSPFGTFGLPSLTMPRLIFAPAETGNEEKTEAEAPASQAAAEGTVDAELSKKREINALRAQLEEAVAAENYEKAIELRDKLRELEA